MLAWLHDWSPLVSLALTAMGVWIMWSLSRKFMPREECERCREAFDKRVVHLESTRQCLEIKFGQLPQVEALHAIAMRQEELAGEQAALKAELAGFRELLGRVEHPLNLLLEGHLNRQRGGKP